MDKITRRQFVGLGAALALAGCAQETTQQEGPAQSETVSEESLEGQAPTGEDAVIAAEGGLPDPPMPGFSGESDTLVLVFSRADENYRVGYVETGNTMVLAQMIAEKTGADLFELEPEVPYPADYDSCIDQALTEKNEGARPSLKALIDIEDYKTVFFGFPCWWGDLPMHVYTAIEGLKWEGKTICPFNTHEGSGESGMFATLARECAGSTVTEGLTMRGEVAQTQRDQAQAEVDAWLAGLGY